jgi:hypothetical protein
MTRNPAQLKEKKTNMKSSILIAAAIIALAMPAAAQTATRSFYNGNGSFAGSSVTRANSSSFYDHQGSFVGSSVRHGTSTSLYDGQGRYTGSSINTGPRR